MDLRIHQKLEAIRKDVDSAQCKKILHKINHHRGDLYDFLGLGFALESIHQEKPFSRNDEFFDISPIHRMKNYYQDRSKESSLASLRQSQGGDRASLHSSRGFEHQQVPNDYFGDFQRL